jgi:hypothetical protein
MIYAKNMLRAIIAISSIATAAHTAPVKDWNEFSEG